MEEFFDPFAVIRKLSLQDKKPFHQTQSAEKGQKRRKGTGRIAKKAPKRDRSDS